MDELAERRSGRLKQRTVRRLHTPKWMRREEATLNFLWLLYAQDRTLTTQERTHIAQVIHLLSEQVAEEQQQA